MLRNHYHIRALALLSAFLLLPWINQANSQSDHVQASLVSEFKTVKPGQSFFVGIRLVMQEKWHTYWKNPGDSGGPTTAKWTLPNGWKAGSIEWPTPQFILTPPLGSYAYENEVVLLTRMTVPPNNQSQKNVRINAKVDWLECADVCIPGQASLSLPLIVNQSSSVDVESKALVDKYKKKVPTKKTPQFFSAYEKEGYFYLKFPKDISVEPDSVRFFSSESDVIGYAAPQKLKSDGDKFSLRVKKSEFLKPSVKSLEGVLSITENDALEIIVPLEEAPIQKFNFLLALLFALIGGALLNLMPCVLPILSLKVFGLINLDKTRLGEARLHGVFYATGVISTFLLLAGLLLLLRSGGQQLGWGFQLQSPVFVGILSLFFLFLSFNLFGFFEIGASLTRFGDLTSGNQSNSSHFNSIFTGVIATIVATPCTAPFMGAALGFAITQPVVKALMIFASLGLGMALPYVVLCFFPSMIRFLPKPGPWMKRFKQFMGILMLATVIWLLWVFSIQTGILNKVFSEQTSQSEGINWKPFDPDAVELAKAQGEIVFIDFTAAWCITCQVNDRVVFRNQKVIQAFKDKNVISFKADWTNKDETIAKVLQGFGRNGVPVYVIYKGNSRPELLPEILTPGLVIERLNNLS